MGSKMKVLLLQNVEKLGSTGEIKEVSGGYGRNYLVPKGFATIATRGQIKQAEERRAAQTKRDTAARKDAEALSARINGQTIRFTARVGELDRLYGSITNADIADRLSQVVGTEIDRRRLDLDEPLKRIGIYPIKVRLAAGLEPVVNVVVEGEEGSLQLPALDAEETIEPDSAE